MNVNGYQAYRKVQVQTADQGQLILMCYNGAINFLKQARGVASRENRNVLLGKAQNVLWELSNSLNHDAGEIAANLDALYNYMIRRIVDADYNDSLEPVDEVVSHLEEMKESWEKVILTVR